MLVQSLSFGTLSVLALQAPAQTNYRRAEVCEPGWLHHPAQCEWAPRTLIHRQHRAKLGYLTASPKSQFRDHHRHETQKTPWPEHLQISLKGKQGTEKSTSMKRGTLDITKLIGEGHCPWVDTLTCSTDVWGQGGSPEPPGPWWEMGEQARHVPSQCPALEVPGPAWILPKPMHDVPPSSSILDHIPSKSNHKVLKKPQNWGFQNLDTYILHLVGSPFFYIQ